MATTDAITTYRQASAALRRRKITGGRTAATTNAIARHEARQAGAVAAIESRAAVGALTEENHLLANIAQRKANGAGYGELTTRLAAARRTIAGA
jgi:hypothetical protein